MKIHLLLFLLLSTICTTLCAQRKVERDTIRINNKVIGVSTTNWYCIEGDRCPRFTVSNQNGEKISSTSLKGKTTLITLWISTCMPCRKELQRISEELLTDTTLHHLTCVAIGVGETRQSAARMQRLSHANFPLCYDPSGKIVKKFADNGCPKLFLIDSDGIVRHTEDGYSPEKFEQLKAACLKICNEKAKTTQLTPHKGTH